MTHYLHTLFVLSFLIILSSCFSNTIKTDYSFDNISKKSKVTESSFLIISGNLDTYYQFRSHNSLDRQLKLYFRDNIYFCDFSLPINFDASRLFLPESYPLVIVLKKGRIIYVNDKSSSLEDLGKMFNRYHIHRESIMDFADDSFLTRNKYNGKELNDYLNSVNQAFGYLYSGNANYRLGINLLRPYIKDNFVYIKYILSLLFYKSGNMSESEYWANDLYNDERFSANPLFFVLLDSIPNNLIVRDKDKVSSIYMDISKIDLGDLHKGEIRDYDFYIKNISSSKIFIYQTTVSCSCIEVSSARIIYPKDSAKITIRFHTTDQIGDFIKECTISLSTSPHTVRIPIYGKIINP